MEIAPSSRAEFRPQPRRVSSLVISIAPVQLSFQLNSGKDVGKVDPVAQWRQSVGDPPAVAVAQLWRVRHRFRHRGDETPSLAVAQSALVRQFLPEYGADPPAHAQPALV